MAFLTEAANRGSISTGYDIDNSVKLEQPERLNRGYDGAGNIGSITATDRKKTTLSYWVKRTQLNASGNGIVFIMYAGNTIMLGFENDKLRVSTSYGYSLASNALYRDTSAWYHLVFSIDTTQGTANDRVKVYVNGEEVTSWSTQSITISQNANNGMFNEVNGGHYFGWSDSQATGCYVAEAHCIDGQALAASDFGDYDINGIWVPIEYTGTYGNQGYYLDFKNASNLGEDQSGNGNDFGTFYGGGSENQATDTPTNNFCTVRPMWTPHAAECSLIEGGTVWKINMPNGSGFNPNTSAISTFQFNSGKWYWETTWTNDGDRSVLGIVSSLSDIEQTVDPDRYIWWDGGHIPWNFSGSGSNDLNPPTYDSINTIGIALDMDNDRIAFSKDGGWLDSSGNTSDSSPGYFYSWSSTTFLSHAKANGNVAAFFGINTNANTVAPTHNINFGGYAATIRTSGGNSDADGYGNFAYSVPSGFYAACTKNLAEYGG